MNKQEEEEHNHLACGSLLGRNLSWLLMLKFGDVLYLSELFSLIETKGFGELICTGQDEIFDSVDVDGESCGPGL